MQSTLSINFTVRLSRRLNPWKSTKVHHRSNPVFFERISTSWYVTTEQNETDFFVFSAWGGDNRMLSGTVEEIGRVMMHQILLMLLLRDFLCCEGVEKQNVVLVSWQARRLWIVYFRRILVEKSVNLFLSADLATKLKVATSPFKSGLIPFFNPVMKCGSFVASVSRIAKYS
jgi:hypothetical protein